MTVIQDTITSYGDSMSLDSFGRLRASELTTQIDVKQHIDNQPLLIDKVESGTATNVYTNALSSSVMTVPATNDYAIAQTKTRGVYQSGKSQLCFITFAGAHLEDLNEKKIGYFSADAGTLDTNLDGIFFSSLGTGSGAGTYNFEIHRKGTLIKRAERSADWLDPLDGTGNSGITLDFTKSCVMFIDFGWLGFNRIRLGFVIGGRPVVAYEWNTANISDNVFMQSPNQPVRWQIENTGGTSGSLKYVCGSVNSEGSVNEIGKLISVNDGLTKIDADVSLTRYLAIGLRLSDPAVFVKLLQFSLLCVTANDYMWELILNPTIAGSVSWTNVSNSKMQYVLGATANTVTIGANSVVLDSGFGVGTGSGPASGAQPLDKADIETALRLGTSIAGVYDIIGLVVTPIGNNADIYRSIGWLEES